MGFGTWIEAAAWQGADVQIIIAGIHREEAVTVELGDNGLHVPGTPVKK